VEAFLPNHDVYVTDWLNARAVPMTDGRFDLDDYIDYIVSILHTLGADTHFIAVCQPSVPVMAAVALMEADNDPYAPASMVLMGGPIDTRINPTAVNALAVDRGVDRSEEHTSELQSLAYLVCRLLLEKKKIILFHLPLEIKKNRHN